MGNFEYKTEVEGQPVTLVFRRYGDAPGRISRRNVGNIERQVWAYLEWGLISPEHWPEDSAVPGHLIFDVMPQREVTKAYRAWQEFEDDLAEQEREREGK